MAAARSMALSGEPEVLEGEAGDLVAVGLEEGGHAIGSLTMANRRSFDCAAIRSG